MKNIILLALTTLIMVGCIDKEQEQQIEEAKRLDGFNTIVIDSCEYLKMTRAKGYEGFGYFSHKGNCRFCQERKQKELEKLIKELKEK